MLFLKAGLLTVETLGAFELCYIFVKIHFFTCRLCVCVTWACSVFRVFSSSQRVRLFGVSVIFLN